VISKSAFDARLLLKSLQSFDSESLFMSFAGFDEPSAWAIPSEPQTGDIVTEALKKDKFLKYVYCTFLLSFHNSPARYRDIAAAQEDLRGTFM